MSRTFLLLWIGQHHREGDQHAFGGSVALPLSIPGAGSTLYNSLVREPVVAARARVAHRDVVTPMPTVP